MGQPVELVLVDWQNVVSLVSKKRNCRSEGCECPPCENECCGDGCEGFEVPVCYTTAYVYHTVFI